MLRVFQTLFILLMLGAGSGSTAATTSTSPDGPVEKLHATLLHVMRDGAKLGFKGRSEKLSPVLSEVFDFETIARVVTGRHWAALSAEKKQEFTAAFTRLSTATYAKNFSSFGGEQFETRATEDKRSARLVKTALVKTDGKEVSLNYLVTETNGMWRIVNVIAEGVSDLSLKRVEYGAVIGLEGIDALIAKLNEKVASYGS